MILCPIFSDFIQEILRKGPHCESYKKELENLKRSPMEKEN
jgi:hypothetical protein